jgi:hypothetical protein
MLPFRFGLVKGFCVAFFITVEVGIVVFWGDKNGLIGIVFPVVYILGIDDRKTTAKNKN